MPWLALHEEIESEFGGYVAEAQHVYVAAAYAQHLHTLIKDNERRRDLRKFDREYARRLRTERNARERYQRAVARTLRKPDIIPHGSTSHVCACGKSYAMPGGLVAHRYHCKRETAQ